MKNKDNIEKQRKARENNENNEKTKKENERKKTYEQRKKWKTQGEIVRTTKTQESPKKK